MTTEIDDVSPSSGTSGSPPLPPPSCIAAATPPDPDDRQHAVDGVTHLEPTVRAWLAEPTAKRIERCLTDITILYPTLTALLTEIDWLVLEPRRSRARGLIIVGEPGSGKTAISKIAQRKYPVDASGQGSKKPARALAISVSGARTTKAVLTRILVAAKAPVSRSYTIGDQEQVVLDTLRNMHCRLLILDEVQDVLSGRASEQMRVIEVIKHLMNELSLSVLCLGAGRAQEAFKADPHLSARFDSLALPKWTVGEELAAFLTALERHLPLRYRSDLARPEMQKLLVKAADGVLDRILRMVKNAAVHAIADGTERITVKSLPESRPRPHIDLLNSLNA